MIVKEMEFLYIFFCVLRLFGTRLLNSLVPIGDKKSHRVDNIGSNEKRAIRRVGFEIKE